MKKNKISIFIVCLMSLLIFAGCNKKESKNIINDKTNAGTEESVNIEKTTNIDEAVNTDETDTNLNEAYFVNVKGEKIGGDYGNQAKMNSLGFYSLLENSADVVVVGSSHVYRYWQNAFAFKECGIASASWATSKLPFGAMKNVIIETLKTQNPKLLVLDVTVYAVTNDKPTSKFKYLLNTMKYSSNYEEMIDNYCKYTALSEDEKNYYKSGLELVKVDTLNTKMKSYLNSCYIEKFLTSSVSGYKHISPTKELEVSEGCKEALYDLLEWTKQQEVEILFYAAPLLNSEKKQQRINYVCNIIEENGFEVINFNDEEKYEIFGFDDEEDFQDLFHTNIKGSYKFTKVFGEMLVEKYNLADHRNESEYNDWQSAADDYYDIVGKYIIEE